MAKTIECDECRKSQLASMAQYIEVVFKNPFLSGAPGQSSSPAHFCDLPCLISWAQRGGGLVRAVPPLRDERIR